MEAVSDHDMIVRIDERQQAVVRRLDALEHHGSEPVQELTSTVKAVDVRVADIEKVMRRLAWIVISWTLGLVLTGASIAIKYGHTIASSIPNTP